MKNEQIDELHECIDTLNQALIEVNHAQRNGPKWYTKGENGMYQQVTMWLARGYDAASRAKELIPKKNPDPLA